MRLFYCSEIKRTNYTYHINHNIENIIEIKPPINIMEIKPPRITPGVLCYLYAFTRTLVCINVRGFLNCFSHVKISTIYLCIIDVVVREKGVNIFGEQYTNN